VKQAAPRPVLPAPNVPAGASLAEIREPRPAARDASAGKICPGFVGRGYRPGSPGYRVKNRRNPPKIRDPRSAATGLPSGGKGHVSLK